MSKKIVFILIVFFFAAGFLVHAFFFPAFLTSIILFYAKQSLQNKQVPVMENTNKALTYVLYSDGEFDPQVVMIGKSYYIGIVNVSDSEHMTLTSDNPLLRTPRDYAKSEQLQAQLYEPGVYTVSSKLHPDHSLKIIVK